MLEHANVFLFYLSVNEFRTTRIDYWLAFYLLFQVLDEEAEVFVVKMWRLLIYETEAKKAGLVKWRVFTLFHCIFVFGFCVAAG